MRLEGDNPELFINPIIVDSVEVYNQMMVDLEEHIDIILDCETVGKTALPIFHTQEYWQKYADDIYNSDPEFAEKGLHTLEMTNRYKKDYEMLMKEKYGVKNLTLNILTPEERSALQIKRKNLVQAERDYLEIKKYIQTRRKVRSIQGQIDKDKSALHFYSNILGLVQIGTFDGVQYLIYPEIIQDDFKNYLMSRKTIIGLNLKFDLIQMAHHLDIKLFDSDVVCFDIMFSEKTLNSGILRSFSLKSLCDYRLNYEMSKEESVSNWLKRPLNEEQIKYAALDGIAPGLIFLKHLKDLQEEQQMDNAMLQMEFLKVLTKTEYTGIYVDLDKFREIDEEIDTIAEKGRRTLGEKINDPGLAITKDTQSPAETLIKLKEYGELHKIPQLIELTSTSVDAFEAIEDDIEILKELSEFRSVLHTKENFCAAVLNRHVNSRIHTNFIQLQREGTRMSSREPNVQNIPTPGEVDWDNQTFEEAYLTWQPKEKLRTGFIPTPGYNLFVADYGQIELCMIAYYSQDPEMLNAILTGVDIHALTAKNLFGLEGTLAEIKKYHKRERKIAKTFNFAVVYGAGIKKLIKQLFKAGVYDLTEQDVFELRKRWYLLYAGIKAWQNDILAQAKGSGFCTTQLGRKIYFMEAQKVYSKAFNTPIQASCYEGLEKAGIILNNRINDLEKEGKINYGDIRIVNFVHDEILVEAKQKINDQCMVNLITNSMIEGIQPLMEYKEVGSMAFQKVPVSVDCAKVERWSDKA